MSAVDGAPVRQNAKMPRQHRFYGLNHLHYLTTSTYRRARLFDADRFKRNFITVLGGLRAELGFRIVAR
jgi:hypothetical protein